LHYNIIRIMKSKRMRWGKYVVPTGIRYVYTEFESDSLKDRVHFLNLAINENKVLKCILKK
jgi:hypothetical protein